MEISVHWPSGSGVGRVAAGGKTVRDARKPPACGGRELQPSRRRRPLHYSAVGAPRAIRSRSCTACENAPRELGPTLSRDGDAGYVQDALFHDVAHRCVPYGTRSSRPPSGTAPNGVVIEVPPCQGGGRMTVHTVFCSANDRNVSLVARTPDWT